jgi:DNA mismatch repair protein MutS
MCGVPVHAAEGYLLTLIRKGFRVAVCEQMEDPAEAKKRGAKSVVHREVVRLVTPGTLTEESLLEARRHNYLAAYAEVRGEGAFAWADVSTGTLTVSDCPRPRLGPMLARLAPREVLVSEALGLSSSWWPRRARWPRRWRGRAFDSTLAAARDRGGLRRRRRSRGSARSGARRRRARGDRRLSRPDPAGRMPLLRPPVREAAGGLMQIDAATRRNLELTRSLSGGRDGSLLAAVDRTVTGAGRGCSRRG